MSLHLLLQRGPAVFGGRWRALPPQDRRALAWLGGVSFALLLYLVVWQPGRHRLLAARADFAEQRALFGYLVQNASGAAIAEKPRANAADLPGLATRSAAAFGLAFDQMDSDAQGRLQVGLGRVGFAGLQRWLWQLQQQGVQVEGAVIERTNDGMVDARLVLRAAG